MNWFRIIRENARDYRETRKDLRIAKWRLKSVSKVYRALEDPDEYDLFIGANAPREGAFVCNLKPSIVKKIREIILQDLNKEIDAELKFIKELEEQL